MVFVTEMDIDNASFREVVEKLTELYGKRIAPFHLPIREHERLIGYVNVVKMADAAGLEAVPRQKTVRFLIIQCLIYRFAEKH